MQFFRTDFRLQSSFFLSSFPCPCSSKNLFLMDVLNRSIYFKLISNSSDGNWRRWFPLKLSL